MKQSVVFYYCIMNNANPNITVEVNLDKFWNLPKKKKGLN